MNTYELRGKFLGIRGRLKQGAGVIFGNRRLEQTGALERDQGALETDLGAARRRIGDALAEIGKSLVKVDQIGKSLVKIDH